jgi:hypothetical protein
MPAPARKAQAQASSNGMGVDQIVGVDRLTPDLGIEWAHERPGKL